MPIGALAAEARPSTTLSQKNVSRLLASAMKMMLTPVARNEPTRKYFRCATRSERFPQRIVNGTWLIALAAMMIVTTNALAPKCCRASSGMRGVAIPSETARGR